ncbi:MAG: DUF3644 domain-containing protein [Acidobacteriaceae bacterium]
MARRKRRFGSIATELVKKSREAMLTAVQIYNNPQIEFKSELFIITTVIAWTYLMHAYYRKKGIEYRQFRQIGERKRFLKTTFGAIRRWGLEECLKCSACPLDEIVRKNLMFLIGIRHEVEHQMTTRIDDQLSAKFQAAALNFNAAIKKLFGDKHSLDAEQAFSIQFAGINESAAKELLTQPDLPQHIRSFVVQFESGLSQEEYDDPRFSYRVAFVRKTTTSKTAADKVVQFIPPGSEIAAEINKVFLKETEKVKYRPGTIVKQMRAEGFTKFGMTQHTDLWKNRSARDPRHQFGVSVEGYWFWYEAWVTEVRKHCQENEAAYKTVLSVAPVEQKVGNVG